MLDLKVTLDQEKYVVQFRQTLNRYAFVSDDSFAKLLAIVRFRTVKKNECLLSIGQVSTNKYFVCRGILVSVYLTSDGGEHIKTSVFCNATDRYTLYDDANFVERNDDEISDSVSVARLGGRSYFENQSLHLKGFLAVEYDFATELFSAEVFIHLR